MYYDKAGHPIDRDHWASLIANNDYKRVALTDVGDIRVSTVWLGMALGIGNDPPLIFETMTFGGDEEIQERYSTETEAIDGHIRIVRELEAKVDA